MIITTISDEIGVTLKEQIDVLKEVNIKYIEIRKINNMYLWEYAEENLKEFKEELDKNEIKVITIDTPIGKKNNAFNCNENKRLLEIYIKIANIFEAKYLRIFSDIGKASNVKNIKEELREILNQVREDKIEILIENETNTYAESASECNNIISETDNAYILFDIDNAYSRGYDILEEYKTNKNRIKYIHLRDYSNEMKSYIYIGQGSIPIAELLKKLKNDEYIGIISLETMLPKYNKLESRKEIFIKSYKSLKKLMGE